jgi:DNA repair ATPase RecN
MIQVKNGGLYATTSNKVSLEQFNQLRQSFEDYQTQSQELLSSIQDLLDHDCSNVVSENSIMSMVVNAVSQYNEDITYIVQYYNSIYERLESLESKSKEYTDKVFEEKSEDIAEAISHSVLENVWGEL